MQIPTLLSFPLFFFIFNTLLLQSTIQGFQPLPAPSSGDDTAAPLVQFQALLSPALAPKFADGVGSLSGESIPPSMVKYSSPAPEPAPMMEKWLDGSQGAPTLALENGSVPAAEEIVRWCAVREEGDECHNFVSVINQLTGYTWRCVKRDTTQDCLESIKRGEADLVNLEAGLAYIAFINYSMKAIANEIYCDKSKSYEVVAVVNRRACEGNENISLMEFKGHKSCHGGYSTAAGWNYPINYIERLFFETEKLNDWEIASRFFSGGICAPSEIEGSGGICNGCGKENGSCPEIGMYSGHLGAFRCLVEEMGDIAFVKGDTPLHYSKEGPYNQSWSTKSVRDFMYLCPQGGCREINDFPGDCSLGAVPANVIMAHNSMPNTERLLVLETLTNSTLMDALYAPKSVRSHLFSPSTQELAMIRKVTRSYLGKSASISQSLQILNTPEAQASSSVTDKVPGGEYSSSSCICCSQVMTMLSLLMLPLILGVLGLK